METALVGLLLSTPILFFWLTGLAWRRMQIKATEYQLIAAMKALGIVQVTRGKR